MIKIEEIRDPKNYGGSCSFCNSTFSVHHKLFYNTRDLRICKLCLGMYFENKTQEEQEENFHKYYLQTKRISTKNFLKVVDN